MPERIPNGVAKLVVFRAIASSDHFTPTTGKTIAITISKNGATSFSNPNAGATNATEMASGFYKFTLDTTDTGTNGPLAWRGAGTGVDDIGDVYEVVNATNAGFTALPNVASGSAGSIITSGTGTAQLSVSSGLVTLAGVTHTGAVIPTVTTLTNLPAITAGWLTAAGIAASALNGKGDWNVGKTGYSLTATTGLGNQTADITGNLSGSVGSVTGAVGSVTAAVTLPSIPADWITSAGIAAGAITSSEAPALANLDVALSTVAGYIDTEVAAIKAKTDNLPANPAAAGDAMTLTAAYDFAKGTVAMTEGYAADGATMTPAQALHMIWSLLAERSIVSTTLTAKKLDGSTTAMTFTLDSATAPTAQTRAT